MISATGLSVRRQGTAHWQGLKRGALTATVPKSDTNRRERTSFNGRLAWHR
jgi:hypothetical protein